MSFIVAFFLAAGLSTLSYYSQERSATDAHSGSLALTPARHTRLFFSEINYLSSYFLIPPFRPLLHLGGGHCRKGESEGGEAKYLRYSTQ